MPVVDTSKLSPSDLEGHVGHQIYNGLDCCVTFEVLHELLPLLEEKSSLIYDFERATQAPALDMMRRGMLIDEYERRRNIKILTEQKARVREICDKFSRPLIGESLIAQTDISTQKLSRLFYEVMKLPVQYERRKNSGERTASVGRKALEKLYAYFHARPFIECVYAIREISKKLSVLETQVSPDGRMRTSYNVTGTETGRWSSSADASGGGTNLQNITPELRRMFIADPGKKLCNIDGEQAESRLVGLLMWALFSDPRYLDACEQGDLHTFVAMMIWPELAWVRDNEGQLTPAMSKLKANKEVAEQQFYRHFTYRDIAKRGGHGTNYYGTPYTLAQILKVEQRLMQSFNERYVAAFPAFPRWWTWTAGEIQTNQYIDTPLGDRRHFFGRTSDDATLREAIAHVPQSMLARLLNLALWRTWRHVPEVELLLQVHDSFCFQYDDDPETEAAVIPKVLKLFEIPLTINGRTMIIPGEAKIGWNWANAEDSRIKNWVNPDGLVKWRGTVDKRRRQTGLHRVFS